MSTRFTKTKDRLVDAVMEAYEDQLITKVEFEIVRAAVIDVMEEVEEDEAIRSEA